MCRMLAVMCNDEDLLSCAIAQVKDTLRCTGSEQHDGVGVGYYRLDDPLLIRRPSAPMKEIDYGELLRGISSKVVLVHVRRATVGSWKDSNTHPFRFRKWLFAHIGHLPALEAKRQKLIEELPAFLSRDIRGETDSELAFHLLLQMLFREGRLNEDSLGTQQIEGLLAEFVHLLNNLHEGMGRPSMAFVVTNGQVLGAYNQGVPLHFSHREGLLECPLHHEDPESKPAHGRFRGILIAAELFRPGHQWREVPDGSLLHVSGSLELKVRQL